jgi:hypothetical protein
MEATIDLALNFGKEKCVHFFLMYSLLKSLNNPSSRVCPIFKISNVTGAGHDYVRVFASLDVSYNQEIPSR